MALCVKFKENKIIEVIISGCHGFCSNGCTDIRLYKEIFNISKTTIITRLMLHLVFKRDHVLNGYITEWESVIKGHPEMDGIKTMQSIIYNALKSDKTWEICEICEIKYANNELEWENIQYIIPHSHLEKCLNHS